MVSPITQSLAIVHECGSVQSASPFFPLTADGAIEAGRGIGIIPNMMANFPQPGKQKNCQEPIFIIFVNVLPDIPCIIHTNPPAPL
jgi:hypothetical protein